MKLRNIYLLASALVLSTSALAGSDTISRGGAYFGFTGGWGEVTHDTDTAAYFGMPAEVKSGGFAGRAYLGYLMPNNSYANWSFGPELGYSFYPHNTYTLDQTLYNSITKESAFGIDLLLNATYALTQHLNLAVKPGVQYASQEDASVDHSAHQYSALPVDVRNSKLAPEIILNLNWQVLSNIPLFVGASYQYVFADSAIGTFQRLSTEGNKYASVTSRQMLGLNLEYLFN